MLLIGHRNFILLAIFHWFLFSCQKEINLRKGDYSFTVNDASYFFEGMDYDINIETDTIILIDITSTTLEFFCRTTNNWGQVIESTDLLQVSGNQISGELLGYQVSGSLKTEDKKRIITGKISFEYVHEYLCTDSIYSYPCSAIVTANGPFIIAPI